MENAVAKQKAALVLKFAAPGICFVLSFLWLYFEEFIDMDFEEIVDMSLLEFCRFQEKVQ